MWNRQAKNSEESEYMDVDPLIVIEIEIYAHEIQIRFPIKATQKRPESNIIEKFTQNQKQSKRTIDFPLGLMFGTVSSSHTLTAETSVCHSQLTNVCKDRI